MSAASRESGRTSPSCFPISAMVETRTHASDGSANQSLVIREDPYMNSGEDYYALGSEVAEISSWRKKRFLRGYGYLYTFGMVEEFILPFVLDHVRPGAY